MPERFKVVCIPCKALYKCSAFLLVSCNKNDDDDDDDETEIVRLTDPDVEHIVVVVLKVQSQQCLTVV